MSPLPGPPEKWDEDETPTCDCCGYPAPLQEYPDLVTERPQPDGRPWRFCDVCSHTFAASALQFPSQYPGGDVMRMLAWSTNYLRDCAAESALVCAVCVYTSDEARPAATVIDGTAVCDDHSVYVSEAMSKLISAVRRDQAAAKGVPPS